MIAASQLLADEIDDIGSALILAYGHLSKDCPPGPPLSLVTRLCKVRNALRADHSRGEAAWEGAYSLPNTASVKRTMDEAARYRWLRDHDMVEEYSEYITANLNGRGVDPLDSTIDAAMIRATSEREGK